MHKNKVTNIEDIMIQLLRHLENLVQLNFFSETFWVRKYIGGTETTHNYNDIHQLLTICFIKHE